MWQWLVLADIQLHPEMRIYKILHPSLELAPHQVLNILLMKLLLVQPILVSNLHLRIVQLNEVPFVGQRLRIDSQILRLIEQWFYVDNLAPVLLLHVFSINHLNVLLQVPQCQCILAHP